MEKKTRDIGMVKSVKDNKHRVLVKDEERWRSYFDRLLNRNQVQDMGDLAILNKKVNYDFIQLIQKHEILEAFKKMRSKKTIGPDGIPIEDWKCFGEIGIAWLTTLFNNI
jgi:hypothetical protein